MFSGVVGDVRCVEDGRQTDNDGRASTDIPCTEEARTSNNQAFALPLINERLADWQIGNKCGASKTSAMMLAQKEILATGLGRDVSEGQRQGQEQV